MINDNEITVYVDRVLDLVDTMRLDMTEKQYIKFLCLLNSRTEAAVDGVEGGDEHN